MLRTRGIHLLMKHEIELVLVDVTIIIFIVINFHKLVAQIH